MLAVLGGDVTAAALIGDEARRGGHHHDGAVAAGDQRGQQRLGDVQGAEHVDLVHGPPVGGVGVGDGLGAERAASVVDQHVAAAEGGGEGVDGGAVGDIQDVGTASRPAGLRQLRGQRVDPVGAARGEHHAVAGRGELRAVAAPMPLLAPVTTAVRVAHRPCWATWHA